MPHNPTKLDLAEVLGYAEKIGIDVDGFPRRVDSTNTIRRGHSAGRTGHDKQGRARQRGLCYREEYPKGVEIELMNGTQLL